MFRGRQAATYHANDHMQGHGYDKVKFLWTCPTAGGQYPVARQQSQVLVAGFFFEETLGTCRSGADSAGAFEATDHGGYCVNEDISGRPEDVCQHECLRTTGCSGYEVYDTEYLGVCTTGDTCTTNKCKMFFLDGAAPTCPTDWTATAGTTTVTDHYGDGTRKTSKCYTKKTGQAFDVLKPVISLPGQYHCLLSAHRIRHLDESSGGANAIALDNLPDTEPTN